MGCGALKKSATQPVAVPENPHTTTDGKPAADKDRNTKKRASEHERKDRRLLNFYDVGDMLGQGAFGVVYECQPKSQKGEKIMSMAVKMVDKVESPVDKIQEETDLLRKMNHPHVVKCHDVFWEKCFVCIVMDRLQGGDLISAMQRHWKSHGRIPFHASAPIVGQMSLSLEYLHQNNMVHRDVKGDNYLCTVGDVVDPNIRIVLTDFGTALEVQPPDKRLNEKCGTKLYWSPEFYMMNYSYKVDIWAMGVVFYGLLNGRFPFRNEDEVKRKPLKIGDDVPEELRLADYACLEKTEEKRATASSIIRNPVFKSQFMKNEELETKPLVGVVPVSSEPTTDKQNAAAADEGDVLFCDVGANEAVRERRLELVDRLVDAYDDAKSQSTLRKAHSTAVQLGEGESLGGGALPHYMKDVFCIVDKRAGNSTFKYEWWPVESVEAEFKLPSSEDAPPKDDKLAETLPTDAKQYAEGKSGIETIVRMLHDHGISTAEFGKGKAKTVEQLYTEIQNGSAVLMLDAQECKKLVRVVDVVCLRIVTQGESSKFLVESGEMFSDGRRRTTMRLPGTKKEPWETTRQTAERIMRDLVDMGDMKVTFSYDRRELFEEEEMSPSYPGVFTVYRKEIIEGIVAQSQDSAGDKKTLHRLKTAAEWSAEDHRKNTKFFRWMTEDELDKQGITYKAPNIKGEVCSLVQAPIGIGLEDLETYLTNNKVDISKFGKDNAKTLEEISLEVLRGDCTLVTGADGAVIRVVDVVLLKLVNGQTGKCLVQTEQTYPDGKKVSFVRLPGNKRRPDENQFLAAKKVLKRSLKIEENKVTTGAGQVHVMEEAKDSPSYPGLQTIYRKRIITATLEKQAADAS